MFHAMQKRKLSRDANTLAAQIVAMSTGSEPPALPKEKPKLKQKKKNPAAVALGRLGGLKGGKARAKKLSPEERVRIAQLASSKRWAKSSASSS